MNWNCWTSRKVQRWSQLTYILCIGEFRQASQRYSRLPARAFEVEGIGGYCRTKGRRSYHDTDGIELCPSGIMIKAQSGQCQRVCGGKSTMEASRKSIR